METIHSVIDRDEWDLNELHNVLHTKSFSINFPNVEGKSPLVRVLEHEYCSVDLVKLLIRYGADVNFRSGESNPLFTALINSREEPIIRLLLAAGANVNKLYFCRPPLCIALEFASFDVVKLFINPECSPYICRRHSSVLHCALSYTYHPERSLEALRLLLRTNMSLVKRLGEENENLVCFALSNGAPADHIELLRKAGAPYDCRTHASLFHCVTNSIFGGRFRESVVKMLLQIPVCPNIVNDNGNTPLQLALQYYDYEPKAIELLLPLPGEDAKVKVNDDRLLHRAVSNRDSKLSVLKQLVCLGADLDKVDEEGNIPLHLAAGCAHQSVIDFLLEKGSPVNVMNTWSETPMMITVFNDRDPHLVKILYLASTQVVETLSNVRQPLIGLSMLKLFAHVIEKPRKENTKVSFKLLIKVCSIENPDIDIEDRFPRDSSEDISFVTYARKCRIEIQNLVQNYGDSLFSYLRGYSLTPKGAEAANYDFNQLLRIRPDKEFPLFLDIFLGRIGRPAMMTKLERVKVYAVKCSCGMEKEVVLPLEIVRKIIKDFSDEDLLKFILAYFF